MMKASIGVVMLCGVVLVSCQSYSDYPPKLESAGTPAYGRVPTPGEIEICNTYAQEQTKNGPSEMLKDMSVGVGSAPIGAAGDAIGPGTRYGIDETQRNTPGYEDAYRSCMAKRGY
jgi:hypothetical protein